jgi:hypothetical protein
LRPSFNKKGATEHTLYPGVTRLRLRLQVSCLPEKTPDKSNVDIFDERRHGDFTDAEISRPCQDPGIGVKSPGSFLLLKSF